MKKPSKNKGFTIVEAIIVIAIFGVLLAVAAPSLTDYLNQVQSRQNTNEFLSSLLLARSEAVTRNSMVSMCMTDSSAPQVCDSDNGWHEGWIAFEDVDGDGTRDIGDELVEQHSGLDDTSVVSSVNFSDHVTYLPSGSVSSSGSFTVCVGGSSARSIVVNATGRPRLTEATCP